MTFNIIYDYYRRSVFIPGSLLWLDTLEDILTFIRQTNDNEQQSCSHTS